MPYLMLIDCENDRIIPVSWLRAKARSNRRDKLRIGVRQIASGVDGQEQLSEHRPQDGSDVLHSASDEKGQ